MLTVWRIVTEKHASTSFTGEGARLYGGRWNPKGVPVVYTAGTQSLAVLEMLVQDAPLRASYALIQASIPDSVPIERVMPESLPADWREPQNSRLLHEIGAKWCKGGSSAVLAVPSAVIPSELNYILNPAHPDFPKIVVGEPECFITDFRLIQKQNK